jgi:hypothetical protein
MLLISYGGLIGKRIQPQGKFIGILGTAVALSAYLQVSCFDPWCLTSVLWSAPLLLCGRRIAGGGFRVFEFFLSMQITVFLDQTTEFDEVILGTAGSAIWILVPRG